MSFPVRRQQDAPQVRMIKKSDAKQIVYLALGPFGCGPDAGDAVNPIRGGRDFHANSFIGGDRIKNVNDFEWRRAIIRVMYAGEIRKVVERRFGIFAERPASQESLRSFYANR